MIFADAQEAWLEIQGAQTYRDGFLEGYAEQLASTTGPYYKRAGNREQQKQHLQNHRYFTWILPKLAHENPQARVKSAKMGSQADASAYLEKALNRWITEFEYQKTAEKFAADFALRWACALVTLDSHPTMQGENVPEEYREDFKDRGVAWPVVLRIALQDLYVDPAAPSFESARFVGHRWRTTKEELLEKAKGDPTSGWKVDVIEDMTTTTDTEMLGRKDKNLNIPDREEVVCYTIWVPEDVAPEVPWDKDADPDGEGFHGTLYTLSQLVSPTGDSTDQWGWVRDPIPFYGPASGPYVLGGCYPIPDEIFPMSPMIAWQSLAEDADDSFQALQEQMLKRKKGMIADASQANVKELIDEAQDSDVILAQGFKPDKWLPFEQGGLDDEMLQWHQIVESVLADVSGFDQQQAGVAGASGTATAATIADSNADLRSSYTVSKFYGFNVAILKAVCWYMWNEDGIIFNVQDEQGQLEPVRGGQHGEGENLGTFEDQVFSIEPHSMEHSNEGLQQARTVEGIAQAMQAVQFILQMPPEAVKKPDALIEMIGNVYNLPGLADIFDLDGIAQTDPASLVPESGSSETKGPGPLHKGPQPGGSAQPQHQQAGQVAGATLGAASRA